MIPQRLIFLDIDLVLNRHQNGRYFEPECVAALNRILDATKAEIVLTSAWRGFIRSGDFTMFGFGQMLRSHGVRGAKIIGYTRASRYEEPRSAEIADWLRDNRAPNGERRICILDDDPGAFGGRPGVQTKSNVGLTDGDAEVAIGILMGEQ